MSKLKIENSHAELVSASRLCNKLAKTLLAISAIFAFVSCEPLQGTLSSEQNERMIEDTGYPTLAEKAWYYNGKAGEDVTSQAGFLRIDYGQYVKACDNGISGSFLIAYTDISSGNEMTVKKSLAGGMPSGTSFCLDMSPVIEMIDGNTFKDGTATVTVNLSGLVCNAGSQKGRSVSSLSQAIKIKPLVTNDTVLATINTKSTAVAGSKFALSVNGPVSLNSSASISVSKSSGDDYPSSATWSLSGTSSDGKTIYFTCDTDLSNKEFEAIVTVDGIVPVTDVVGQSGTWTASFLPIALPYSKTVTIEEAGTYQFVIPHAFLENNTYLYVTLANITEWGSSTGWDTPGISADGSTWKANLAWENSGSHTDSNAVDNASKGGGYFAKIATKDYPNGIYITGKTGLAGTLYISSAD